MAKNYTIAETVQIIAKNEDKEAIVDIGRRYPLLLASVTRNVIKGGQDFVEFMNNMPEYLTANKVNSALKAAIENADDEADEPKKTEDKFAKKSAAKTTEASDDDDEDASTDTDYESMNGKQLWALLGERGLRKSAKSTKKADMIAVLKAADEGDVGEATDEADDEINPYEGKTAMELFKMCKARGLKVKPKQKAKTYADALIADDAAKESDDDDDDDDWDDEEDKAPKKEKKNASKKSTKSNAKSTKKTEPDDDDDDDDDWDI